MHEINKDLASLHADFLQYYQQNLGDKFKSLELVRKKYLCSFYIWCVIFFFLTAFIVYLINIGFFSEKFLNSELSVYSLCFYIVTIWEVLNRPFKSYKKETKRLVMDKILAFFGDFTYSMNSKTSDKILKQSGLIEAYDKQYADDFFSGIYHGVKMQVSDEKLTKIVRTNKGSYESTVFDGVIILLDMNKSFSGQTVVRSDWGMFNFLMCRPECKVKHKEEKLEKVVLEDSRFEKYFETFSNNQVEARYVLTTAFMERILKVKKLFHGTKIEFSFFNNQLLILVPTSKDMFETTSLFTTTARYGKMREVVNQFYSIFSIIDLLKLNQKIGM